MKKFLALILALCFALSLCACTEGDETENTTTAATEATTTAAQETEAFKVTVVDQDGNAVSGVMLQVCKDSCLPALTDAEGVATFSMEITDGCKLSVSSCPEGYVYSGEAEIYLEAGATEYTLELEAQ